FNSPTPQLDIGYCLDQACVVQNLQSIIGPIPAANTNVVQTYSNFSTVPPDPSHPPCSGTRDVTISGPVVAFIRSGGSVVLGSPAQAFLSITIKAVNCVDDPITGNTLSRTVGVSEVRTNVFAAASSITIFAGNTVNSPVPIPASLMSPSGWTGCPLKKGVLSADCGFPFGIVELSQADRAAELPANPPFIEGDVYRATENNPEHFIGLRDCKGDPTDLSKKPVDPGTIACSVSTNIASAVRTLVGSYSGGAAHTFNPTKGPNPYD